MTAQIPSRRLQPKTFDVSDLDEASLKDEYSVFDCEDLMFEESATSRLNSLSDMIQCQSKGRSSRIDNSPNIGKTSVLIVTKSRPQSRDEIAILDHYQPVGYPAPQSNLTDQKTMPKPNMF